MSPCNDRKPPFVVWPITELEDTWHSVTVGHETGEWHTGGSWTIGRHMTQCHCGAWNGRVAHWGAVGQLEDTWHSVTVGHETGEWHTGGSWTIRKQWAEGGDTLSIKFYWTGLHPVLLCEWTGCTISNNKHCLPLSMRVKHQLLLGGGRGSAADTIYNSCLIS